MPSPTAAGPDEAPLAPVAVTAMSGADRRREFIATFTALRTAPRSFWVCNLIFMLDGAAYFGVLGILTLFLSGTLGISDHWSHLIVAIFLTGPYTLFGALFGGTSDRWGVRRTLTVTIVVALLGRLILTLSPHLLGWHVTESISGAGLAAAVGLVVIALAGGVMQPAVYAGVKQSTTPATSAIGFSLLYALTNAGSAAIAFSSSPIRKASGTTGVFWVCVGLTLVYLVAHLALFPRDAGAPLEQPRSAPHAGSGEQKDGAWFKSLRGHALLNPRFQFFIFILLGVRTLFAHQWLTMPQYVTRAYSAEVSDHMEQIVNMTNPVIVLIATPLFTALTKRTHVVNMMILGTFVSAVATFLLVPGPHLGALLAYVILFSVGESLWSSRFLEYVAEVAPPAKVGLYMGVAQIPWFLAKTTTGFYSGFVMEKLCPPVGPQNTSLLWLIYAVVGMTTPIGLFVAARWLKAGRLDDHEEAA